MLAGFEITFFQIWLNNRGTDHSLEVLGFNTFLVHLSSPILVSLRLSLMLNDTPGPQRPVI